MKIRSIHTKIGLLAVLAVAVVTLVACGRSDVDWLWNDGNGPELSTGDMIIRVTGKATDPATDPERISDTTAETDAQTDAETPAETATDTVTETEAQTVPETTTETATETATEPATETATETASETELDTVLESTIPYIEGETHPGTDIRYEGTGENRDKIIVIDAGHQAKGNPGQEPLGPYSNEMEKEMKTKVSSGTSGVFSGTEEYELNLRVALALRDELIQRGYSVVMIRETHDVDVSNAERALIANDCHADACIRLHANGSGKATDKGAMVVCQTKENPFPNCRAVYAESKKLSECLLDAYCKTSGIGRYETLPIWETDTMTGINWSAVPTTILEMGFMSNQEDDLRMAEDGFAQDAATGIANGLDTYFAAIS